MLTITMNTNYAAANGVAVVITSNDCLSARMQPYAAYVPNGSSTGVDQIQIGSLSGGGANGQTVTYNYHVIEVR